MHLRGANGVGKTTLLKLIAGLYQPAQGQIKFLGKNIENHLQWYHKHLCYVGHKSGINPNLSLKENCFFDVHYDKAHEHLDELAGIFKLEQHLNTPSAFLSAGQRRQASLLRLWFSEARLWLLDEPLVALDEAALEIIMVKIADHRAQGGAVLLTSHQNLPLSPSLYEEYCL